jgi:hypothetical protein
MWTPPMLDSKGTKRRVLDFEVQNFLETEALDLEVENF